MVEVTFAFPSELDLAFYYLDRQFARFLEEGIDLPSHEISFGETSMIILMWYPDDDESDNDDPGGGGDDPIWPIEPVSPSPERFELVTYNPEWTYSWS